MNKEHSTKAPATVKVVATIAPDNFTELSLDVAGGYVFRDRLKASGFKFIRDKDAPPDPKTGKPKPAVWRRILVAVPPDVEDERAAKGINDAVAELETMLDSLLEGSRVRGAKEAAAVINERWDTPEIESVAKRIYKLDTPWNNSVQRPAFAA